MSPGVVARCSAGLALLAQTLVVVAACLCAPAAPGETATNAPPPPCHQAETGLRMAAPDSYCCQAGARPEATARVEATSIFPVPLSPAHSVAAAGQVRPIPALRFSEPARPRPPLRI